MLCEGVLKRLGVYFDSRHRCRRLSCPRRSGTHHGHDARGPGSACGRVLMQQYTITPCERGAADMRAMVITGGCTAP